jgi:hypothetical protein
LVHGDAIAINAGTAAYFLSMHVLNQMTPWMTKDERLKVHDLFFLTLRGGHAGQVLALPLPSCFMCCCCCCWLHSTTDLCLQLFV